jgi:hypothetical protein
MSLKEQREFLVERLESQLKMFPSLNRSFAYLTGPAYGVLLDLTNLRWRKGLKRENDFGELIQSYYDLKSPTASKGEAETRAKNYDGASLRKAEEEREKKRQERISQYRKQFVDNPVLLISLVKAQRQFNPSNLQPMGELGTVYPTMQVIDVWGTVNVKQGALLSKDLKTLTLSAPKDPKGKPLIGDGWDIDLKEGWELKPGKRARDWQLGQVKSR